VASLEPAAVANDATIDRLPNCCPDGPCNPALTPNVVATRATTANGEIGFSSSRDVCRVTIHSDVRGLCPNRNDGHDLRAPYARDHDRGRHAPERYRRRLAQRREPAARLASPRPVAWALSPMRRERRHRSAENDSFGISPLGRGCAAQDNVPALWKFREFADAPSRGGKSWCVYGAI
jgi:hypothetical protein